MGSLKDDVLTAINEQIGALIGFSFDDRADAVNKIRTMLLEISPFADNPVDNLQWVKSSEIVANDYNPNTVAPPEMRLLTLSIEADGFTQPIVVHAEDEGFVVVDGFHRNRVGRENAVIREALRGYLPVVRIRAAREQIDDRMASTIRHNRARGKHGIDAMTGIVTYLARKGWSNEKIAKEVGMDPDEVLRHKQITGLAEMFSDREFSQAWEAR